MYNFLEQGSLLYVMGAICLIGIICKFAVNHNYRSLIRQSENLSTAKDRQLQQMKVKYESIYRINSGVKNSRIFVDKLLGQYRFGRISLAGWDGIPVYCALLSFLAGAWAALMLYIWKGSARTCIMYLAAGGLLTSAMLIFTAFMDSSGYREALTASLYNYFENVLVVRMQRHDASRAKSGMKDDIFMRKEESAESPMQTEPAAGMVHAKAEEEADGEKPSKQSSDERIDSLKESLAQIAAARGQAQDKDPQRSKRKLSAREQQLIDDIIDQYLN